MSFESIHGSDTVSGTDFSGGLCSRLLSCITNGFSGRSSARSFPWATPTSAPSGSVARQRKIPSYVQVGTEQNRKRLPVQQDQSFVSALQELIVGDQSWKERLSTDLFKKEGMDMRVSDCPRTL
jgi:hypothetical protein